jgi:hypothetical protein
MEPTSSPQSGRSAREAARRGADAIRHSRFLGAQEPRPLSGAPQARSQPQASDPLLPKPVRPLLSPARMGCGAGGAAWWLSVVVRSGPFRTAVNGTLVARPSRTTPDTQSRRWLHPDRRVRPVLGDNGLVGKPLQTARQLTSRSSHDSHRHSLLRNHGQQQRDRHGKADRCRHPKSPITPRCEESIPHPPAAKV